MQYEARVGGVSSRRRAAVTLLALVCVLVSAVVLARWPGSPTERPSPSPHAAVVPPGTPGPPAVADGSPVAAPPHVVRCRDMPRTDCVRSVQAALAALATPTPTVDVAVLSTTPMCHDDRDCPPELLAEARSVGSVVLTFEDGTTAWVNVFEPAPDGVREGSPRAFVAVVFHHTG
jgi:hypothetical protein